MFKGRRILVSTLCPVALAALAALSGCGQRGPLYLPAKPAASLPQTLQPPAATPTGTPAAVPAAGAASAPVSSRTTSRP
ncbi:hypothetical protein C6568_04465 [Melaminivora suipulveris]|uniref:Sugar transporter n=1 Tax=Melaminivora suipulveris TaxID=2109913 RepID=A0A2R3QAB5_9BURK|nr:lipoprotein [Melaminivora suipulveris]AVO48604.1 hypothetical protein C6568_04465 [Melaminivora suipulveris]